MKIGLLTFHRAINYGAVLQCYGLYKTLESMGHSVDVIDYRPVYIEDYRKYIPLFRISHLKSIRERVKLLLASFIWMPSVRDANKRFNHFIERHFSYSSRIVRDSSQMPQDYDLIIVGSDQVWSPSISYGFDPVFWGQFSHQKTTLSSYAASLEGLSNISESDWVTIKDYLLSFKKISVREKSFQDALKTKLGLYSECNIDPSLLLSDTQYDKIIEPNPVKGDYVLAFSIVQTPGFEEFSNKIAQQLNCKIVSIVAQRTPRILNKGNCDELVSPSVGEFLALFKNAKCVVTTSFHGTVFSIIYHRPFYTAKHKKNERVSSLLSQLDLSERMIDFESSSNNDFRFEPLDFDLPQKSLNDLKYNAKTYLDCCVNNY